MKNLAKTVAILLSLIFVLGSFSAALAQEDDVYSGTFGTIAAGENHSLALKTDGTLWGWGDNYYGILGDIDLPQSTDPIQIMSDVKFVATGFNHGLAIKNDNSLWAWGDNYFGQVGNDSDADKVDVPEKVLENVVMAAAGADHSMAITENGDLYVWGSARYGQLGNGIADEEEMVLTPMKLMEDVAFIAAGEYHSLAVKTDGTLLAWGDNFNGQIGLEIDEEDYYIETPYEVMDDVRFIAAGQANSMAIKTDNSLLTWGQNGCGQLGNGESEGTYIPQNVMEDVAFVSAGYEHTMALKTDGSLWTFGGNNVGQLGTGEEDSLIPIKIMEGMLLISAGSHHCLAVRADGILFTWGSNEYMQLGYETEEDFSVPPTETMDLVVRVILGDVNSDGLVNTGDAVLILKYLSGNEVLEQNQIDAADFNQDGKLNTGDATAILLNIVG
ncbi:MAG: chromosome condensation regulator [Clostridiales bacterium]|nr:chromosome condensation regulator [Clostridiales bacterium]